MNTVEINIMSRTPEQKEQETAETILDQLGGNKFVVMTGASKFGIMADGGICFHIPHGKDGINTVKIRLNGADLYDVEYLRVTVSRKTWDMKQAVKHTSEGLYFDMLRGDFERVTGLRTSLTEVYA
jgi:hypothetical protein